MFGSSVTTLIISNEEINDIMKIVMPLEESGLLIKGISKTIKNEAKGQKRRNSRNVIRHLGASFLGNFLTRICAITAGESTIRAGQYF